MPGSVVLLALALVQAPGDPAAAPRELREIVLEGVTRFTREQALKAIRLAPGGRLRRAPEEIADSLRTFYDANGYVAARVTARFDPEPGRLTLVVDEGNGIALDLEGVSEEEEARVRSLFALDTGAPLRDEDVRAAMDRVEGASGGAYRLEWDPPWRVEEETTGARTLRLRVVRRRLRVRPLTSGPDPSPFRNRVEGIAPGLGVDVTLFGGITENHTSAYGRAAYGFDSDAWRYAAGVRRSFGRDHRVTAGYERHDLTDSNDLFRRRPIEGPRGRPIPFHVVDDYYRRRGDEAYVFVRPTPRLHLGASFRNDRHQSLPVVADDSILFFSRRPRPNPEVAEGLMRSLLFTARWSRAAPLFGRWEEERESFLLRSTFGTPFVHPQGARVEGTYEVAADGLGGDFAFHYFTGQARASRAIGTRHTAVGRLLAGFTSGDPPPQRRFAVGGLGTLRGYALKEFAGEHAVVATGEWLIATRPRWPSLVFFYDGGTAWTSGLDGPGWKSDAGAGLEWRFMTRGNARVDVAFPFQPSAGQEKVRVYGMLRLPF